MELFHLLLHAGSSRRFPKVQLAVMADLLRAKFARHSDLAEVLSRNGDGRIVYHLIESPFWGAGSPEGRNWLGRLLGADPCRTDRPQGRPGGRSVEHARPTTTTQVTNATAAIARRHERVAARFAANEDVANGA